MVLNMSRTSKTKIGGEGESNDRMMRAASSGAEAVSQAHSQLLNQHRAGAEQATRSAAMVGQIEGQELDRDQQATQFNQKMAQDESQFSRGLEQQKSATNLAGAKEGYEPANAENASDEQKAGAEAEARQEQGQPAMGPLDPESQQRLQDATKQKLEMDGQGRWRPTQERKDEQARQQTRNDYKADTERMRAIAYKEQVATSAQKALRSGDTKAYDEHATQLANYPNDRQKQYDRMMKQDMNNNDWSELAKYADEPSVAADIKAKQFTPRVAQAMRALVGKESMEAIVGSMGDTSKLKVDWTNPVMQQFQQMVQAENQFLRANPSFGAFADIKSTEDKMRFLNVMAAAKVYGGMASAPNPSGGMTPATTPQGQPGGGMQQPASAPLQHSQPENPADTARMNAEDQGYSSDLRRRAGQRYPR
jgi:hypothetical protein